MTCPRSHGTLASMKGFPARHLPQCGCHHGKSVQRHLKALPLALSIFFCLFFKNLYSFFFEENSTLGSLETLFFFFCPFKQKISKPQSRKDPEDRDGISASSCSPLPPPQRPGGCLPESLVAGTVMEKGPEGGLAGPAAA